MNQDGKTCPNQAALLQVYLYPSGLVMGTRLEVSRLSLELFKRDKTIETSGSGLTIISRRLAGLFWTFKKGFWRVIILFQRKYFFPQDNN